MVTQAADPSRDPREVERLVAARTERQQRLSTGGAPLIWAILNEAVIRRQVGDTETIGRQLLHLVELNNDPNITIQVLPLTARQSVLTGAFIYLKFAQVHDVPMHDMAIVEQLTANEQVEDETDVYQYFRAFEALSARALPEDETGQMITTYARDVWS